MISSNLLPTHIELRMTEGDDLDVFYEIFKEWEKTETKFYEDPLDNLFFVDPRIRLMTKEQLIEWFTENTKYSLTALYQDKIQFGAFLTGLTVPNLAFVTIIRNKRLLINLNTFVDACRECLRMTFREWPVEKLVALIAPENRASIFLAKRVGFKYDGLSRHHYFYKDVWRNMGIYSILKGEL